MACSRRRPACPVRPRSTSTSTDAAPSTPGTRASTSMPAPTSAPRAPPASSRIGAERRLALDHRIAHRGAAAGLRRRSSPARPSSTGACASPTAVPSASTDWKLTSRTARLEARGTLTADRVADFLVSARAVPTEGGITKAADTELDSLAFDGALKGPIARPTVNGTLRAAGLRSEGSALERIDADVAMVPPARSPAPPFRALSRCPNGGSAPRGPRLAPGYRRASGPGLSRNAHSPTT